MLGAPALAIEAVLLDLLRWLTVGRVETHVIRAANRRLVGGLLLVDRWLLIDRLALLGRIDHDVILGAVFVLVICAGRHEQHPATNRYLRRVIREVTRTRAVGRSHDYIARAFGTVPVTVREEIVCAPVRHAVVSTGEAVDHLARTVLRARAPTIAAPVATAVVVAWALAAASLPVLPTVIALQVRIVATNRLLGLTHRIRPALNGQALLLLLRLLALLLVLLLHLLMLLLLLLLLLNRRASLVLAILPNLGVILRVGLLALVTRLRPSLRLSLRVRLLRRPRLFRAISQDGGANTETEQTNTCQTPDARLHAYPHRIMGEYN